jgi:hypothetical protein
MSSLGAWSRRASLLELRCPADRCLLLTPRSIFMEPGSQAPSEWGINDWEKALESFVPAGVSSASSVSSQSAGGPSQPQHVQHQHQHQHPQHQQHAQHQQHGQHQGPPGSSHGPPGSSHGPPGSSYGHGAPSGPSPASAHFSPHYSPPMQHQR